MILALIVSLTGAYSQDSFAIVYSNEQCLAKRNALDNYKVEANATIRQLFASRNRYAVGRQRTIMRHIRLLEANFASDCPGFEYPVENQ